MTRYSVSLKDKFRSVAKAGGLFLVPDEKETFVSFLIAVSEITGAAGRYALSGVRPKSGTILLECDADFAEKVGKLSCVRKIELDGNSSL